MKRKAALGEVVLRLTVVISILATTLAPTPAIAKDIASHFRSPTDSQEETTGPGSSVSYPEVPVHNYDPPFPEPVISELRTSPEPDEPNIDTPPEKVKGEIQFSVTPSKGIVTFGDQIGLEVRIENNSTQVASNMLLTDQLEEGFEFISSTDPELSIDLETNTISRAIPALKPGESLLFSYILQIEDDAETLDKAWIHIVELDVDSQTTIEAQTTLHVHKDKDKTKDKENSKAKYMDSDGGWIDLGQQPCISHRMRLTRRVW